MTDTLTWLIKQLESTLFPATDSCEWRDPTEALNCLVCGELCLRLTGMGLKYNIWLYQSAIREHIFPSV